MYSDFPRGDRIRLTASIALGWTVVSAGGFASAFDPGDSVETTLGKTVLMIFGIILGIAGVGGFVGIITNRYRLEWGSASIAIIGAMPYVIASWWILVAHQFGAARAVTGTLLILYPLLRSVVCLAHSNRRLAAQRLANEAAVAAAIEAARTAPTRVADDGAKGRENETHG